METYNMHSKFFACRKGDCLLDDFTWERMSDERRLKVVQVNKKSLTPNGGDMTSVIESAKYRLLSNVPILVYFFQS